VQPGETKLSQVAHKLGVDADRLQEANPQPAVENEADSAGASSGTPRAPIGDPLAKAAMQARLVDGRKDSTASRDASTGTATGKQQYAPFKITKELSAPDLAQVHGGAHQEINPNLADKTWKLDKWIAADKQFSTDVADKEPQKTTGAKGEAVTGNKAKTADKAAEAMDGYIRG
jgi:hypothetical protein